MSCGANVLLMSEISDMTNWSCLDVPKKSDQKFLSAVIRQAVIAGYLERDIENYGLLKLTPKAKKFLNKPESFKIVEDREFNEEEEVEVLKSGAGCAADPELYSILKDLRKKIARQNSLPLTLYSRILHLRLWQPRIR